MTTIAQRQVNRTPFQGWTDPRVADALTQTAGASDALSVLHINGGLVIRPRRTDQEPIEAQPLTDREREVLALVAEGNSNKVIGEQLNISERTVKSHLTYIMTKLRASDRTHAVVTAVRLGWLAI